MKIYTHQAVDLDAVASVWAARKFAPMANKAEVVFVPANWDGAEMVDGDIAVDIYAGGKGASKGEQDSDGTTHSAFEAILNRYAPREDREALVALAMFIDAGDSSSNAIKTLVPTASRKAQKALNATGLMAVFIAMKHVTHNDAMLVEWVGKIFDGLLQMGREEARAVELAGKIAVVDGVAIAHNTSGAVRRSLYDDYGARMIVFVNDRDKALGLHRRDDETTRTDHPIIRAVVEATGEAVAKNEGGESGKWFAHSAGFLFCWGSRKAPAKSKSRVRPEALADAARAALAAADAEAADKK